MDCLEKGLSLIIVGFDRDNLSDFIVKDILVEGVACVVPSDVAAEEDGIFNGTMVDPIFGEVGTELSGIDSEASLVKGSLSVVFS